MSNQMHATDDILELYSLGRLEEPEVSQLEEHLLICEKCQNRVEHEDECVETLRSALAGGSGSSQQRCSEPARVLPFVNWRWPSVTVLSSAAMAALVLMMVTFRTPQRPQELTLLAQRGSAGSAAVHAGQPL
jgi:anti-sigma factor RsiW